MDADECIPACRHVIGWPPPALVAICPVLPTDHCLFHSFFFHQCSSDAHAALRNREAGGNYAMFCRWKMQFRGRSYVGQSTVNEMHLHQGVPITSTLTLLGICRLVLLRWDGPSGRWVRINFQPACSDPPSRFKQSSICTGQREGNVSRFCAWDHAKRCLCCPRLQWREWFSPCPCIAMYSMFASCSPNSDWRRCIDNPGPLRLGT